MARRTEQYLISLIHELIKFDTETEWVEFKTNNCEPQLIGEYISALTEKESYKTSRIIKDALDEGLIKPVDPDTAPRYMRYIPFWA